MQCDGHSWALPHETVAGGENRLLGGMMQAWWYSIVGGVLLAGFAEKGPVPQLWEGSCELHGGDSRVLKQSTFSITDARRRCCQ